MKYFVIQFIQSYQRALSPYFGGHCRYVPSCSHYMMEAIQNLGLWSGLRTGINRIIRCHPWGGSGWDPAPRA